MISSYPGQVWSIQDGKLFCVEVHDMKDQVHNLTVANTIACFSPQGAGVKVVRGIPNNL